MVIFPQIWAAGHPNPKMLISSSESMPKIRPETGFLGLRSKFNTRYFNTRYFFWFFGHNSLPRKFWGAPLGGNSSYRPPGPF